MIVFHPPTREGAAILRFFAVIFFPTAMAFAAGAYHAADAVLVLRNDSLESCRCTKQYFPCADLEKSLKKKKTGPATIIAVEQFLDSLGFFSVRCDTLDSGRIQIRPGFRALVVSESQQGAPPGLADSFAGPSLPRAYDAAAIAARTREIGRRFAESGYPFARIAVDIVRTPAPASMPRESLAVVYRIEPDRQCVFARPVLSGPVSTRRSVLLRDIAIREGDVFDIRRLEAARDALARREYIDYAALGSIAVEPAELRDRRDSAGVRDAEYVSAPILLRDRTGLGMEGALGFNSREGDASFLQGDLTVSLLNVFHSGESASLLYAGDKTYQKFHMDASKPWLFGSSLIGGAAFGLEIHENAYGFLQGNARIAAEIGGRWLAGVVMNASETSVDSVRQSWQYAGVEVALSRTRRDGRRGMFESDVEIRTGSGIARRERNYTRSHAEFTAGVHLPLLRLQAVVVRFSTMHLITDEKTLVDAELFRVGGYRTVRGYLENEFAFRTVAWDQVELHHYFSGNGSVYIFSDNGIGFAGSLSRTAWQDRSGFLGYGCGVRVPARLGTLSLEWARNVNDTKSLGRIHVQATNNRSKYNGQP